MIKEKNILMFNFNEDISDSIKRIFKDCKECIIDSFTNYNLNSKHTTLTSMDLIFVFIDTHDINKSQNGIDFIKKISSDEKISACIIAVANNAGYEFMALEAGALDYFIYPFNEEIFKLKIRNMISINSSTNILKNNMFFEKYDLLTRVYNRSYFIKKSEEVIKNNNEKNFIIIKTHVSNLKVINQFFNIEEGDKFLCHFAKCIDEVFRDENDCIYGRTEGDKFTICLPLNETTIKSSFKKLKNLVKSHKFNFDYVITYGIYIVKNEKINVELFCDKADIALRAVIGNYINKYAIYNQELHEKIEKEQKIINRMKKALKSGEFQVYFQSQHNIKTNEIVGAEALVRWIHPTDGLISPGEFIPIFESNGFILKLDYYVWEQTCIHIRKWLDEGIDLVPFSVNVSRINLLNPKLCDNIIKLCEKYSIPSKLLQLELTESAYTESPAILQKVMQKLQSKGYKILMDDFGSGYSSLNMLKDIAVDTLKLDLHFLSKDSINGRGANILTSIIRMAKGLDLPVVAEGVETALQAEFLKIVDCDFAQGYLFSRPMPANQFKEFFLQYPKKSMEKINIASNLNNILIDDLWDPKSTANYLFNVILSPVGIFEMTEDKLEAVKINDLYFEMIKTTKEEYYKNCNNILHNICNEDRQLFINAFNQAKLSNKVIDFVYRRIIKNNEMLWIKARCKPVYSNDKKTLFYVVLKNITEEKRKNEMYKMQNEQYKLIIEQTGMLVFDYKINEDTMVYSVENEKGDIVKRRVENYLKYLPSSKVLSKEYLEGFIDHLINARKYESKGYFDFDANFFSEISDGEKYSKYRAYYVSIKNDDNEIFRLVGRIEKILDFGITETSEAVEILKVMYESSPCGICRVNVDNGIKLLYANKQFYKLCGYNEDDLKNKADLFFSNNFISCNNEPNIKTLYNAILKKQPSVLFETQLICKDNVIKNIICGVGITYLKEQTNLNFTIYDITVLKQQQKESLVNKSMYDIAFEKSSVAIWEYDIISQTYRASKAFMKLANYNVDRLTFTKEEATKYITMLNGDITTHLELEKAAQEGKEVEKIVKYKNPFNATKDYWIKILCTPIFDGNGKPIKSIGICQNVSKEKETEKMYNYEKKYREAMNLNSVAFFEIDLTDDNIVLCSDFIKQCSTYCNLSYSQLIENTEKIWIYKDDHKKYFKTLNRENLIECYKKGKQSLNLQYRAKINKEKDYIWVNSNINMILDDKTNHILCTWTTQNINEKKLAEISLKEQAQTDDLTGLLNRQTFENKINNFFSNNQQGAFFMLDVDDFKMINDSYGHTFGDKVLNEISYTLANVFKENAYTARLGGDEFAVFAENIVSIDQGRNKAEEICKAIENILDKSSYRCNISCSVGVAFAPENGTTFHQLYTNADLAQYHAKHTGKNKYYIFDKVCESMNYEWIKDSKWVLDNIDASVYVCDKENFNILFINDYMCKKLEVEKNQCIGEKCYKIFMNRDEPCPFCSSPKIKKHVTFSRTFYLARYKSTILLRGKEILWNNIPARIETAVNITDIVKDI